MRICGRACFASGRISASHRKPTAAVCCVCFLDRCRSGIRYRSGRRLLTWAVLHLPRSHTASHPGRALFHSNTGSPHTMAAMATSALAAVAATKPVIGGSRTKSPAALAVHPVRAAMRPATGPISLRSSSRKSKLAALRMQVNARRNSGGIRCSLVTPNWWACIWLFDLSCFGPCCRPLARAKDQDSHLTVSEPDVSLCPQAVATDIDFDKVGQDMDNCSPLEIMDHALATFGDEIAIAFSGRPSSTRYEWTDVFPIRVPHATRTLCIHQLCASMLWRGDWAIRKRSTRAINLCALRCVSSLNQVLKMSLLLNTPI